MACLGAGRARWSSTARNSSSRRPSPIRSRAACCGTASPSRPPHFDVHQSGTINSLGSQGCMFDNLIRRDPRDSGKTIIPDLAHSWEISKDGKTYTFHPAQGRAVPRRRRAHLGGRQGDLRPHRQAAAGHQHPAQHAVRRGRARSPRPTSTPCSSSSSEPRPPDFIMGADRQRLERASSARRRWRTTSTTCAASSTSPAPARSRASAGSRTKSG